MGTIATDVTESRRAENRRRHSQQLEALGQLTSGIAHDFNNLLATIIGNLDLLRERVYDPDSNRELIDDSLSSASSGRDLVQSLLAFGRRQTLQRVPTNTNDIVRGLSRVIERTLGEVIEVRWALYRDVWPIAVDKSQFETSLLNLVLNARDAMPRGGLLVIETRNIVVHHPFGEHQTIAPGSYVGVTVTDNGAGMTPVLAAQALQPFFTTKESGNGLGLNMVYEFVKQSVGYLVIDSESGRGTRVTMYFPRAKDGPAGSERLNGNNIDPCVQGERILVVEDHGMVRKTAKALLSSLGYTVLDAENARRRSPKLLTEVANLPVLRPLLSSISPSLINISPGIIVESLLIARYVSPAETISRNVYLIGSCTVTSFVPSGKVASTWIS